MSQQDHGSPSGPATVRVAGPPRHLDRQAERFADEMDDLVEAVRLGSRCQQHGQGEVVADDDLLEVTHLGSDVRDGVEERAGEARAVVTGDRHQEGLLGAGRLRLYVVAHRAILPTTSVCRAVRSATRSPSGAVAPGPTARAELRP